MSYNLVTVVHRIVWEGLGVGRDVGEIYFMKGQKSGSLVL